MRLLLKDTYGIAQVAALVVPPLLFVALKTISARLLKRLARFERHSTGSKCEGSYLVRQTSRAGGAVACSVDLPREAGLDIQYYWAICLAACVWQAKSFFIYLGLNVALPTLGYGLLARGLSEAEDFKTLFAEFVTSSSVSVLMIEALFYCPLRLLRGLPVYEYRRRKQRCKELPAAECHEASSLAKEEECRGTLDPRRTHRSAGSGATQSSAALKFRAMAPPAAFDLSRAYAESLSFFALALLYSLVSPLVIPTAAMYFFCKYRADKHIFEEQYGDTVRQPQFSRRLRAVNRYLCLAVFIAQLGPFSYFYFLGSSATETAISGFILAGTLATYLLLVTRTVMWRGRHYDVFSCTEHISRRGRSKHYSAAELAAPRAVSRPYTPSRQCMWGDLTETQQSELAEVLGLEQLGDSNDKQRTRQKPAETTMNGKRPTKDKVKIENPMLEAKPANSCRTIIGIKLFPLCPSVSFHNCHAFISFLHAPLPAQYSLHRTVAKHRSKQPITKRKMARRRKL